MHRTDRLTPIQRMTVTTAIVLGMLHLGSPALGAIADAGIDTARHAARAVPGQADADAYACAQAEALRDPATGAWLLQPDDPGLIDC